MKNQILLLFVVCAVGCSVFSCQNNSWSKENQQVVIEYLEPLKNGGFIADLTDEEYGNIEQCVVTKIMAQNPNFKTFNALPGKNDTIYNVMISCTADFIGEDYHNLRRLFPYEDLVIAGILPDKMSHESKIEFYTCLAGKINVNFASANDFLKAMSGDVQAQTLINGFFSECAAQYVNQEKVKKVDQGNVKK